MIALKTISIKLIAFSLVLMLFFGMKRKAMGSECAWDFSKVSEWDRNGATDLIRRYVREQVSCISEKEDSSVSKFLKEFSLKARRSNGMLLEACILEQLGQYYFLKKDYPTALNYFLKEASQWKKLNKNFEQANTLMEIANLYNEVGDFSKEYTYLQKAYQLYAQIGLKGPLGNTASRLGFHNKENGNYDSALFYLEQAKLLQEEVNDNNGLVYTINHLGRIYKDRGKFRDANVHYQLALNQSRNLKNRHPEGWTLINLGFLALDQRNYEKARPYFERARKIAEADSMQEILRLSFEGLYRLAEQEKNFEHAFSFYRQYQELGDHFRNTELANQLVETEWRYQQELLQKELEIDRLARSRDRLWKLLGIVASVFLLITLGLTWYIFRKKLREAESEKRILDLEIEKYSKKNAQLQERIMNAQKDNAHLKWDNIEQLIHEQYPSFKTKLMKKHPKLSEQDLRFCMLLMTSFSTKEIAEYFNISPASANKSRYRLRRKLGLSREENLINYLTEQV